MIGADRSRRCGLFRKILMKVAAAVAPPPALLLLSFSLLTPPFAAAAVRVIVAPTLQQHLCSQSRGQSSTFWETH